MWAFFPNVIFQFLFIVKFSHLVAFVAVKAFKQSFFTQRQVNNCFFVRHNFFASATFDLNIKESLFDKFVDSVSPFSYLLAVNTISFSTFNLPFVETRFTD
jgi:hypothetical protein